ncbi:unknown [Prevotella sp. CAG:1185]|nr:unknown [Prevotella sp. CAG:1185]
MNTKNQQILKLQAIKLLNNATMSPTKKYFERQQTGLHNDYTNLIIMRIFLRNQTCIFNAQKNRLIRRYMLF